MSMARVVITAVVLEVRSKSAVARDYGVTGPHLVRRVLTVSRCSVVAVAAARLLLPERFSRCCPQPGYRSGYDQG
jgi:hypothetical protein